MEPLSPNDPLHTLLGRARPVEPRPDFTQNVMRAVRQVPQSVGLWERVQARLGEWTMSRMALAGAAAALVVGGLVVLATQQHDGQSSVVAQQVQAPLVQTQQQQSLPVQPPIYHVSAAMILAATAEVTPAAASAAEIEDVGSMGLLVQEDSSALTDSELALLVY